MQSRQLLISFLMLFSIYGYGQQWGHIGVSPEASPGQAITVRGFEDSLRLKMLNVCETGILMAFTDSIGGSFVAAPFSDYSSGLNTIEVLPDDTINGLAGTYGSSFQLLYSTSDSIYFGGYVYNSGGLDKYRELRKGLDDIVTLFGSDYDQNYVLTRKADSSVLYPFDVNTSIQLTDTIPLRIQKLTGVYGGITYPGIYSLVGTDRAGKYNVYEVNTTNGQIAHALFDTLPGKPVFAHGLVVISSDSTGTYLSRDIQPGSTSIMLLFESPQIRLKDVAYWGNTPSNLALLVQKDDTANTSIKSTMLFYSLSTWNRVDSIDLNVQGERIYSSFHNYFDRRYLQYSDSLQNIWLAEVDESISYLDDKILLPRSPYLDRSVSVCFIGIDDINPLPIKTTVYPNPTSDQCHAEIKNVPCDRDHYLELFDMNGRKVYEATFQSKCTVTIPVNGLQAGVYLLKMDIAGRSYTHKIVKK